MCGPPVMTQVRFRVEPRSMYKTSSGPRISVTGSETQKYNHNLSKLECENIISYITTKFFRYLVGIKKKTQNGARGVYQFVPMQDFSESWTDEKLYKKYSLDEKEIEFIESTIHPMELDNE